MKTTTALPILLLLALPACSSSVEGVVEFRGAPVEGARVSLGDSTTVTDANGEFEIDPTTDGLQTLSAELRLPSRAFVAAHKSIDVGSLSGDVTVKLPDPIDLSVSELTSGTVTLQWSPTTSPTFQEYRVIRNHFETLPADRDEILHTEPDIGSVTYLDGGYGSDLKLPSNMDFYYRVVAVDSIGPVAQSNVLKVTIPPWNETTFAKHYRLEQKLKFAGEAQIGGICWDGAALRVAYWTDMGEYYDPRKVWVSRLDVATGETSDKISWDDGYAWPNGIACDSQNVWVNYVATGAIHMEQRNATTGALLKTMGGHMGYSDMHFDGENLFVANMWNKVDVINPANGVVVREYETPFDYSTLRAVATREGEIWLAGGFYNVMAILDPSDGKHIGIVNTGIPMEEWMGHRGVFMTFIGEDLAFALDDKIRIFKIVPE